jgi:dienelactone hydrolase
LQHLYVPSKLQPGVQLPAIFIFDPAGDGFGAVELFAPSAELFGYVLIGSNNIKNGYDSTQYALELLINDVFRKGIVDQKQIYTAGFSGGARVAQMMAMLTGRVNAVISCGAGLSGQNPADLPKSTTFFFAAGYEDFNFLEVNRSSAILKQARRPFLQYNYDGKHAWPCDTIINAN